MSICEDGACRECGREASGHETWCTQYVREVGSIWPEVYRTYRVVCVVRDEMGQDREQEWKQIAISPDDARERATEELFARYGRGEVVLVEVCE